LTASVAVPMNEVHMELVGRQFSGKNVDTIVGKAVIVRLRITFPGVVIWIPDRPASDPSRITVDAPASLPGRTGRQSQYHPWHRIGGATASLVE